MWPTASRGGQCGLHTLFELGWFRPSSQPADGQRLQAGRGPAALRQRQRSATLQKAHHCWSISSLLRGVAASLHRSKPAGGPGQSSCLQHALRCTNDVADHRLTMPWAGGPHDALLLPRQWRRAGTAGDHVRSP